MHGRVGRCRGGLSLFIFGGANWDAKTSGVVNASEAHAFDALKNQWRKIKPLPSAVRGMTGVTLDNHRIYLAGGYKSDPEGFSTDAFIYDENADGYTPAKPLPYAASVGLVVLRWFCLCASAARTRRSPAPITVLAEIVRWPSST